MDIINSMRLNDTAYYSEEMLNFLEDHLVYLNSLDTTKIGLEYTEALKYKGDLFGILNKKKIDPNYHYVVMRINGFKSSSDFTGEETFILVPDFKEIDLLKNVFQTKK